MSKFDWMKPMIGEEGVVKLEEIDAVGLENFRDAPSAAHVPADAEEWTEGLLDILNRIPDGWGRWITIGRGWYPIVVELDRQIAELYPDYNVHQCKEKFGTLRFYCSVDGEPQVRSLVDAAEARSGQTCEACGISNDTVTTDGQGWITTRCSTCRKKPTQFGQF